MSFRAKRGIRFSSVLLRAPCGERFSMTPTATRNEKRQTRNQPERNRPGHRRPRHERRSHCRRMRSPRRRRILHARPPRPGRNPKRIRLQAIGVRVFFGQRAASTYSSDFSKAGLDRMVSSALELAKITSEDPFGGIPDASLARPTQGRSRSLPRRRLLASRRRPHRICASRRKSCARLRSAHQEFRRRILRRRHRTKSSRQLSRLRRRI